MKCPVCIQEGKKSMLQERGGTSTLMSCQPFHDEEGKRHHHDINTSTYGYSCSNGHSFNVSRTGSCWCGWNKDVLPRVTIHKPAKPITILELSPLTGLDGKIIPPQVVTDPEVLKAMTDSEGSDFSILGNRHGCG